jgi:hypothetical protein
LIPVASNRYEEYGDMRLVSEGLHVRGARRKSGRVVSPEAVVADRLFATWRAQVAEFGGTYRTTINGDGH